MSPSPLNDAAMPRASGPNVTRAATADGYTSPSRFSRELKRQPRHHTTNLGQRQPLHHRPPGGRTDPVPE